MGRFYQTDKPTFVQDGMFQMPYQLAAQVIGKVDAEIAANETATVGMHDLLNAEGLKVDEPRLREILSGYEKEIDAMSRDISENPLNYRKKTPQMRDLSRKIEEDFSRGEVAAIQGNKNAYNNWLAKNQEAVKSGGVMQDSFTTAKNKFYSEFAGTNYKDGDYQSIYTEDLNKYINIDDIAEKRGEGYITDILNKTGMVTDGEYFYKDSSKNEKVPYETVYVGVMSALQNDRELQAYLTQEARLGRLGEDPDKTYQDIMTSTAARVAEKFGHDKTTIERTMTVNSYGLEQAKLANKKAYKQWEKDFEEKPAFDFVTTRSSELLNKDQFNPETVNLYADSLKDSIKELKKQAESIDPNDTYAITQHKHKLSSKESALAKFESIDAQAQDAAMWEMKNNNIIDDYTYDKYNMYKENQKEIDEYLIPILLSIEESIKDIQPAISQKTGLPLPMNEPKANAKDAILKGKMKDPAFRDAYEKYNAGNLVYEGDPKEGKHNKYVKKWYQDNQNQNVIYNSAITVGEKDTELLGALDQLVKSAEGNTRILMAQQNQVNPDGSINAAPLDTAIDPGFWNKDISFSMSNIAQQTGKNPSELFTVIGIEPSATGPRIIYEYNEAKLEEAGVRHLENMKTGDRFMVEVPNAGFESYITDRFKNSSNNRVTELVGAMNDEFFMQISDQVDQTIKDITAVNYKGGPKNILHLDGVRLEVVARENSSGGYGYTFKGADTKTGEKFKESTVNSSSELKTALWEYLHLRKNK